MKLSWRSIGLKHMVDHSAYPNDETGNVLRRLADDGADLSKPHCIDFYVAVSSEAAANQIMAAAARLGYQADLNKDEVGSAWTVCLIKTMVPTYSAISHHEAMVDSLAKPFGGRADGWGAFPVT